MTSSDGLWFANFLIKLPEEFPTDVDLGFIPNPRDRDDYSVVIQNVIGILHTLGRREALPVLWLYLKRISMCMVQLLMK